MAKELPYFKFESAEWLTGRISFESLEVQGAFIQACSVFWNRLGSMTRKDIEFRIKDHLQYLIDNEYIEECIDGYLIIEFLEDQLNERKDVSTKRAEAGRKGGQANAKQIKANAKQKEAEERRGEKNRVEKSKVEERVVFPFDSKEFIKVWDLWVDYKKEHHKFKYKTPLSEQAALKKLSLLGGGDEKTCILIIEESISNGWKGFFKLKDDEKNRKRINEPSDDAIARIYARTFGE